jgi:hypothetical protein
MKKSFVFLLTICLLTMFFVATAAAAEPVAPTVSNSKLVIHQFIDMNANGVQDASENIFFEMVTQLSDFPAGMWTLKMLPSQEDLFSTGCTVDGVKQGPRDTAGILLNGVADERHTAAFGNGWKWNISSGAFSDTNKDGGWDTDEPGIAGVGITLKGTNLFGEKVKLDAVTDSAGKITFKGLIPGKYNIEVEDPDGMTILNSLAIEPRQGENINIDFGFGPYSY